jgi:hypothetical protein
LSEQTQKKGKVPEGIVTTETQSSTVASDSVKPVPDAEDFVHAITSLDPKAMPDEVEGYDRVLIDQQQNNNNPRNIYIETITTQKGKNKVMLWWHCENGTYVGRKEVIRINPRTEERHVRGHDYNVEATNANVEKITKLATGRTKFYKKYLGERSMVELKDFHT